MARIAAAVCVALAVLAPADAFTSTLPLARPTQLRSHAGPIARGPLCLKMQTTDKSAPEVGNVRNWEVAEDPVTKQKYYWNTETGETSWEKPSPKSTKIEPGMKAPKKIFYAVDESARDERWNKFQKVMELQKEQDEIKKKTGGFTGDARRLEVLGYASLVIGLPVFILALGFATGTLPNPFVVCVEGGTSC